MKFAIAAGIGVIIGAGIVLGIAAYAGVIPVSETTATTTQEGNQNE